MIFEAEYSRDHQQAADKGVHVEVEAIVANIATEITLGKSRSGTEVYMKERGGGNRLSSGDLRSYKVRLKDRRDRDDDDRKRGRRGGKRNPDGDDYDLIINQRAISMVSYAIDVTNWQVYVGYSGPGSAVFSNSLRGSTSLTRRRDRVRPFLINVQQRTRFDPMNCAEVAALNVALSYGAHIGNLFFISMDTERNLRNPCENCIQWITDFARGYLQA